MPTHFGPIHTGPIGVPCPRCGLSYLSIVHDQTLNAEGTRVIGSGAACSCGASFARIVLDIESLGLVHRAVIHYEPASIPPVQERDLTNEPKVHLCGLTVNFESPTWPLSNAGRSYTAAFEERNGLLPRIVLTGVIRAAT